MNLKQFWTPIMVIIGILVIVMLFIILEDTNTFPQVDWSVINPEVVQFIPWIIALGLAFVVFLHLRRR
jgi:ABC-type uncharacterized transport system permease subunit